MILMLRNLHAEGILAHIFELYLALGSNQWVFFFGADNP